MRRLFYITACLSIALNILAVRMFYITWRRTYALHERIRSMSEHLGDDVERFGYRIVYADDKFTIACDQRGSCLFHSQLCHEPVSLSIENQEDESVSKGDCRCIVSTRNFFASWRIGADKCDRVVFQYNDIGRKDDTNGDWNIKGFATDRKLYFTENWQVDTQESAKFNNGSRTRQRER